MRLSWAVINGSLHVDPYYMYPHSEARPLIDSSFAALFVIFWGTLLYLLEDFSENNEEHKNFDDEGNGQKESLVDIIL